MNATPAGTNRLESDFEREVTGRFGLLPNFFSATAAAAPGLMEQLWSFAKSAYLDNPLPSLFKERLFVRLSRFCEMRYCIVRHVGFLLGHGRPAGDGSVAPHTVEQVLALLRRPIPTAAELDAGLARLEERPEECRYPDPRTELEADLFDALTVLFLDPVRSERARLAALRCMGATAFEYATALLAFIRTAHYWTEIHPALRWEPDMTLLMQAHPELGRLLLNDAEADAVNPKQQLQRAILALENAQEEQTGLRKALDRSESRMAAIFAQAGVGLSEISLQGRFLRVNDELCRILGRSRHELLSLSIADVTAGEDRDKALEAIRRVREKRATIALDKRCVRPNGAPIWVNSTVTLQQDDCGHPDTLLVVTADLTARKAAEEAQRASEERLRRTLETEAVAVMFFDHSGTVIDANDVFFRMTGHTRSEVDRRQLTWRAMTPAEWAPLSEEQMQRLFDTGRAGPYEKEYFLANGARRWFLFAARDLGDGTIVEFCIDITDRKQVEAELRQSEARLARELEGAKRLQNISSLLIEQDNGHVLFNEILDGAMAIMSADFGSIQMLDADCCELNLIAWRNFHPESAEFWRKVSSDSRTSCGAALRHGERIIIPDVRASDFSRNTENLRHFMLSGIVAVQSTPLTTREGRVIGILSTHWRESHTPGDRELRLLDVLARQATDFIERRRSQQALFERQSWLRGQREALESALNGAPLNESLEVLVRTVTEQLGQHTRAAIYVANAEGTKLHRVAGMNEAYGEAVDGFKIGSESLACGLATHTGRPVITPDVTKEPLWAPWLWLAEKFDYRGCWSFPIRSSAGKFVGTLAIYWRQPRDAARRELDLAELITQTAAIIIVRHTDALERARAETALRASENRFRLLVENVLEYALFQTDLQGRVTSWNRGAERLFGYSGPDLSGESAARLFTAEDQQILDEELALVAKGKHHAEARWVVRKDGTRFWAQWVTEPVYDEAGELRGVVKVLRDETERKRAEERQLLLMGELDHRVKNTLAIVQSMATQTLRNSPDASQFVETFQARLQALARAHNLLTRQSWESANVTDIVRDQLTLNGDTERITVQGPPAFLSPSSTVALSLVLHELGTNARKYGALSAPSGRLQVLWRIGNVEPVLTVDWTESHGPSVSPPERRGFGATLIEKSLRGVGGTTKLQFLPGGLVCQMEIPLAVLGHNPTAPEAE
ncbi:MAG: PAS domain S-box protein [Acidobacteriaceae bacterium]|nr:PAS domain S-box protein [Acidobacteriaceae bacterium]